MTTTPTTHGCPVTHAGQQFDPYAADYLQDPYPHLRAIREQEPVFYAAELDYWIVSRYEDVKHCFMDQATFSAAPALDTIVPPYPSTLEILKRYKLVPGAAMVNEDPPGHRSHRKQCLNAFSSHRMRRMEPFVRELATGFIDTFVKNGNADLVVELFYEFPALVVFKFFGIPDDEVEEVKAYAGPLALFNWGKPTEAEQNRLVEMVCRYYEYSCRHLERLKDNLGDDLASDLLRAHLEDPENWPISYIAYLLPNFLYAGHETTTSQAGNALRILLEHRDQWERLCAEPALIPNAVEECIRAVSSVIAWRRRTKKAVTIHGVEIPPDANLLIYSGAANRDEDVFSEGERFDITRENARHSLSFGYGAHLCLGAPLARLELKVLLEELTRRLPHMHLVEKQSWQYSANTSFRGPAHLLVEWDPSLNPVPADAP